MSQNETRSNLINLLRKAVEGLYVMSESDYPLEVSLWQDGATEPLTADKLLQGIGKPQDDRVEEVALEDFFRPMTQPQNWHGAEEEAIAQKFQTLVQLIRDTLTDVTVYRVGKIDIDVYIVGKMTGEANLDNWVILTTKVIET